MSQYFPTADECSLHTLFGCVQARTYTGTHLQFSLVTIPPHGIVDWHAHPHEQMGMVIQGEAVFFIGEQSRTLHAGDFYFMPGEVPHRVEVLEDSLVALDVFHPPRDEYR